MVWLLLVLLGLVCIGWGTTMLTQATIGVGVIGIGCFFAIVARLIQAAQYQRGPREQASDTRPSLEQNLEAMRADESRPRG